MKTITITIPLTDAQNMLNDLEVLDARGEIQTATRRVAETVDKAITQAENAETPDAWNKRYSLMLTQREMETLTYAMAEGVFDYDKRLREIRQRCMTAVVNNPGASADDIDMAQAYFG